MNMVKIMIADGIEVSGLKPLAGNGKFKLVFAHDSEGLKKELPDVDALLVRSKTKVTEQIFDLAKQLKFVGRAGVGVDNIDVALASKQGIIVENVPGGNTISAAEHTMAMMLALTRNIPQSHESVRKGEWKRDRFVGTELQGKVLGLLGFGRIGREVAKRALSFEMKVMAYDTFVSQDHIRSFVFQPSALDEVLS